MFIFVKCHKVVWSVVILPNKIIKMIVWTGRTAFDTTAGKKWQKSIFFCPMSQTDKKQLFSKKTFFHLKKRSPGQKQYSFDNPADFFGETSIDFVHFLTLTRKRKKKQQFFFKQRQFSTKSFRSRRLQVWQIKRKVFDKKGQVFSLNVRKSKKLKKSIITFSEERFPSSKSSYEQVESSTDYPAGKHLS